MTTRKDFLKLSAIASGSVMVFPSLSKHFLTGTHYKPGLQLYTVRDAMSAQPQKTLSRVASIGYKLMEGATYTGTERYYGMKPEVFSKVLKQNGLSMPSSHYRLGSVKYKGSYPKGTILHDWNQAIEDATKVGQQYMVCAYLDQKDRQTLDDYKRLCDEFNKAGENCKKAGIQFCYHNHDFEFEEINGQQPYNILLNNTDKDLVKMEMDIYWVYKGGADPLKLFKEHSGRFVLWHVKDMDNTSKQFFTSVGNGIINWEKIFSHADEAGLEHFFVEQDVTPGSPFKAITKSINYLEKNIPDVG